MTSEPALRFNDALKLRSILIVHATGGVMDDIEFRGLRERFFIDPAAKKLLPRFVRDNFDGDSVWAYLKDFYTGSGAYAARRKHITEQFQPLLEFLSEDLDPYWPEANV